MTAAPIPDPRLEPVLTVERAGALFGLRRSKAYSEARRYVETGTGLPTLAFGKSLRCPTQKCLELLGLEPGAHNNGASADGDVARHDE
jgi:hypothetical protein